MNGDFWPSFGEAVKRPTAVNGEEPSRAALDDAKDGEYCARGCCCWSCCCCGGCGNICSIGLCFCCCCGPVASNFFRFLFDVIWDFRFFDCDIRFFFKNRIVIFVSYDINEMAIETMFFSQVKRKKNKEMTEQAILFPVYGRIYMQVYRAGDCVIFFGYARVQNM